MLLVAYYAYYYAGIIGQSLLMVFFGALISWIKLILRHLCIADAFS